MHSVDISNIYTSIVNPFVQDLLQGLALVVVGWFSYVAQKYGPKFLSGWLEQKAAKDLNTALANGTMIAMNKLSAWEQVHKDVQVQGQVAAWAAEYAVSHAPGAVDKFGLNPEQLATKALAYIPAPPTTTDTTGAKATLTAVSVGTLPPVSK